MRYLHHVTITTGDTRRSWRHEIDPEIMAGLAELVAAAREDGGVLIPGIHPACRLYIEDTAQCALCSVRTEDGAPVVRFAVADHARCGAKLWRLLIETARTPVAVRIEDRPETPWCAVRIESGITLLPQEFTAMLGDMTRCIAWAWLGRR